MLAWKEPFDLLGRGQKAFTGLRFYEAQTLWEAEALGARGDLRDWLHGLATIAAGMLAHDERRIGTAHRLLARGRWLLATAPEALGAVDIAAVRAAAAKVI